ncbi:MAG: flippase-like domain-containing protein [bacterium]|nr:flippase-like domain-containing protein [bacterium]
MKKLIVGIIISIIFLYFSLRGVSFADLSKNLKNIELTYLFLAVLIILFVPYLRSLRWGIVLSPIKKIPQKKLYPMNCVGWMALTIIPMRIGELVRPYLIKQESGIPLSSGLAVVFVERVFDLLILLLILGCVILSAPTIFPNWIINSGYAILVLLIFLITFMIVLYFKAEFVMKLLNPLLNLFPNSIRDTVIRIVDNFIEGFHIIKNAKQLMITTVLSVVIWFLSGVSIYLLFMSYNYNLSLMAAFSVLTITQIAIFIPSAPGFIGNFQYGVILSLAIFGISKDSALIFSILFYFSGIGINILLGLIFMPIVNISFKELFGINNKNLENQETVE